MEIINKFVEKRPKILRKAVNMRPKLFDSFLGMKSSGDRFRKRNQSEDSDSEERPEKTTAPKTELIIKKFKESPAAYVSGMEEMVSRAIKFVDSGNNELAMAIIDKTLREVIPAGESKGWKSDYIKEKLGDARRALQTGETTVVGVTKTTIKGEPAGKSPLVTVSRAKLILEELNRFLYKYASVAAGRIEEEAITARERFKKRFEKGLVDTEPSEDDEPPRRKGLFGLGLLPLKRPGLLGKDKREEVLEEDLSYDVTVQFRNAVAKVGMVLPETLDPATKWAAGLANAWASKFAKTPEEYDKMAAAMYKKLDAKKGNWQAGITGVGKVEDTFGDEVRAECLIVEKKVCPVCKAVCESVAGDEHKREECLYII